MTETIEEMEIQRDQLESECSSIQLQLDRAKAEVVNGGEYADPNWFTNARYALRRKRQKYNELLRKLGRLNKEDRIRKQNSIERTFIEICKTRLGKEVFAEYWEQASDLSATLIAQSIEG